MFFFFGVIISRYLFVSVRAATLVLFACAEQIILCKTRKKRDCVETMARSENLEA